ncbi:hypothetical protein HYZ78_00945 [Candidatus Microgenomates bacterium]|nr:hypothetical protein [Candidatus Microgenomates bacterium]
MLVPRLRSGRPLDGGANPKKQNGRENNLPTWAAIAAFFAAWWARGFIAIVAFGALAWLFLVPPGTLGKPGTVATQPQLIAGPTGPGQQRVIIPPAATAVPAPAARQPVAAPTPDSAGQCYAFHDYGLLFKPEVATSGTAIQVEYWNPSAADKSERETFMMANEAGGGRFLIVLPGRDGHVWEYKGNCDEAYLMTQMRESTARRLAGGADNRGYVPWRDTGLFQPAVAP